MKPLCPVSPKVCDSIFPLSCRLLKIRFSECSRVWQCFSHQRVKSRKIHRKKGKRLVSNCKSDDTLVHTCYADELYSHLQRERNDAAVRIQSAWKARCERRRYSTRRKNYHEHRAATVIQKAVSLTCNIIQFHVLRIIYHAPYVIERLERSTG